MNILIIPGLTLQVIPDAALAQIRDAAGEDAVVTIADHREAITHAAQADIIFGLVPKSLFVAAPGLRWVHAIASGVDMFLYPEFIESDVLLTSEKGLVGEHLADHGFGLLLMLTRQLHTAFRHGADGWNHRPEMRAQEIELTGRTMGIIGYGGTGRAFARRARAFGMRVIALDRDPVGGDDAVPAVLGPDGLQTLLGESDVVSVCVPLTSETKGLLNAQRLAQMKPGAFLVNVTRGEVMDEAALVQALESGGIAGAALDVAPREPLPADSRLWALPNVVMTPHTAGASQFRADRNIARFITNLARLKAGQTLEGLIDKKLGY
ncbi:MAG: D-2-hydroxyacid dehydrogenase [Proteobacteria bacterium]|nr:D-2-hydroxyacid dehydrogenase [Pseudomonadota bacterium]